MEGKEKSPIRKIERSSLDYQQFNDDIAFFKICSEIASQAKFYDSEKDAYDDVLEFYTSNEIDASRLFQRYGEYGPIGFEYLKKKYGLKLNSIGLDLEEIKSFEIFKISRDEEDFDENSDDVDKTDTRDFFLEKALISIKDYKKFVDFLKKINARDIDQQFIYFIDTLLLDFIKGLKKEYSIEKPDERLEELILASNDIVKEIERFDSYFKDPVFDRLPEFQDYLDAARGGYLVQFRKETQ